MGYRHQLYLVIVHSGSCKDFADLDLHAQIPSNKAILVRWTHHKQTPLVLHPYAHLPSCPRHAHPALRNHQPQNPDSPPYSSPTLQPYLSLQKDVYLVTDVYSDLGLQGSQSDGTRGHHGVFGLLGWGGRGWGWS